MQNLILLGSKVPEFHTGYRASASGVLETLPLLAQNSDDFVFDNEMLTSCRRSQVRHARWARSRCPTRYFPEASQINFRRSVVYGCGVLWTGLVYRLWKWKLASPRLFLGRMRRCVSRPARISLTRAC